MIPNFRPTLKVGQNTCLNAQLAKTLREQIVAFTSYILTFQMVRHSFTRESFSKQPLAALTGADQMKIA